MQKLSQILKKRWIRQASAILPIVGLSLFNPKFSYAEADPQISIAEEKAVSLDPNRKIRMRNSSEYMSPSFQGGTSAVPKPEGNALEPTNIFNIFWTDYSVAENLRILYYQRFSINLAESITPNQPSVNFRDPRLGIRRTKAIDAPGVSSYFDFYFQPGVTENSKKLSRVLDVGSIGSINYTTPQRFWKLGIVADLRASMYQNSSNRSILSGFLMPWISYNFTQTFSTQHWFYLPYQHRSNHPWHRFSWGYPHTPYVQNGMGIRVSKQIWAAFLINNYLTVTPTLQNTWASLWANFALM